MEHISEYAKISLLDETLRKDWLALQKERLLSDEVAEILEELEDEQNEYNATQHKAKKDILGKLINYITDNSSRMQYATFQKRNLKSALEQ